MPKLGGNMKKGFQGWGCNECSFILPNPRALLSMDDYVFESMKKFEVHECAKFPLKRKRLQSSSQG